MRAGASCAVQQTLTTEAASVLKHSLNLARRRGHGQVTPLHVAATLLTSRSSLLKRACLKSQPHHLSHPLQCRALELCFNVALNRLPTSPGPFLNHQPSLSNALIAALKRAQAHQRRGCIEQQQQQQQQPLLAIKVELEHLIISILDDPSVSRVMREAGFSSPSVKTNLEDSSASSVFKCYSSSGGVFSSPCSPSPPENQTSFWHTHFLNQSFEQNPLPFSTQKKVDSNYVKEDVKLVLDVLLKKKRRNIVIVGDCESITDGVVTEVKGWVEKGEIFDELKPTHFIKFQFPSVALRFMKREDVEMNVLELKRKVDSLALEGQGAIIFTGDLKWTVEANPNERDVSGYSPIDHLVAELGRLVFEYSSSNSRVWLMATASYQTYMRCQMRQPSLEIQWAFQAVSVPSSGLGLTLHASSVHDSRNSFFENPLQLLETKPFANKEEQDKLNCCHECTSNYEKEAQLFKSGHQKLLHSWLQSHGIMDDSKKDDLVELRRKWNRFCHSLHQGSHSQNLSSYPWWPSQRTFNNNSSTLPRFRRQNSCTIEFDFGNGRHKHEPTELSLDSLKKSEGKEVKITLTLGNSMFSDSGELAESTCERICKLLTKNVPWQSESIPSIAKAVTDSDSTLQCKWLLIQGNDLMGKRRLAQAISESLFGSTEFLLQMNMRDKENEMNPCSEILLKSLRDHQKLVVLVENVDFADTQFMKILSERFETQKSGGSCQAIFILTMGDSVNYQHNQDSVIEMTLKINETTPTEQPKFGNKRKPVWDFSNKFKCPRTEEKDSTFTTLDLNIKAGEGDENVEKPEEFSSISSDLTRETSTDIRNRKGLIESIPNCFIFERNSTREREIRDDFLSKMTTLLEEVYGIQKPVNFTVEERVLEEMVNGLSRFENGLFEKWLKQIFQTSLETVKFGGEKGICVIRLCFGGKGDRVSIGDGFNDSILPKKIQVSFGE